MKKGWFTEAGSLRNDADAIGAGMQQVARSLNAAALHKTQRADAGNAPEYLAKLYLAEMCLAGHFQYRVLRPVEVLFNVAKYRKEARNFGERCQRKVGFEVWRLTADEREQRGNKIGVHRDAPPRRLYRKLTRKTPGC